MALCRDQQNPVSLSERWGFVFYIAAKYLQFWVICDTYDITNCWSLRFVD
jgi:hypothetical protein